MTLPMRRARGGRVHGIEPPAMLRRDPFADVRELLNRMRGLTCPVVEAEAGHQWVPVAEIDENDEEYVVRLELPGIAPGDIDIRIRDRELCVNGEVREEEKRSDALRVRGGRFHYHTSLPSDVDADNVEASMDQGVLTLRVPKAQRAQGHCIAITGGWPGAEQSGGQLPHAPLSTDFRISGLSQTGIGDPRGFSSRRPSGSCTPTSPKGRQAQQLPDGFR